jgi:hypothetical protein
MTEVKDMRHRLTLLGTATSLALAAAVVTAGPAEARRNLGGTSPDPSSCVLPGEAVIRSDQPGLGTICICVIAENDRAVRAVGTRSTADCPPGIPQP